MHWLLNPDAELELARPRGYTPKRQVLEVMRDQAEKFRWLTEGDPSSFINEPPSGTGQRTLLWCPTPRGLDCAKKAGLSVPPAPSLSALTAANLKGNVEALGLPRPTNRAFVRTHAELCAVLGLLKTDETLRAKRAFSFAGRSQRRLHRELSPGDASYVAAALNAGGLLVESEQVVEREWSIHGVVWGGEMKFGGSAKFECSLGRSCSIQTDEQGSVIRIQPSEAGNDALVSWAEQAALGLFELGYFGPFGLDFLEGDHGLVASDLNARFTLGWSIGMGTLRDSALVRMFQRDEQARPLNSGSP